MKHTSEALGWVVLETITRHDRYTYQEIAGGTTLYRTKQAALKVKRDCENRRYERRGERVYTVEPVGSDPSAVRELVEAAKLGAAMLQIEATAHREKAQDAKAEAVEGAIRHILDVLWRAPRGCY